MRISVILPYLNAAPWLQECLQSLQLQVYQDIEFLLINDHSTDESESIVRTFADHDPRFVLLRNPGRGLVAANAHGLSMSTGQLISRMDADDMMAPNKIQALAQALLLKGPGHIATGYVRFFPDENTGIGTRFYQDWLNARCDANDHWEWIWRECVIPSPCWMAWKSDLLAVNAFDAPIYPDDYELAFRFFHAGLKVLPVRDVLHHWRQHASRMSRKHGGFSAEAFTELKWEWFKRRFAATEAPLYILGHGKKAQFLATILYKENYSFSRIKDWNKVSRLYTDIPVKDNPYSIVISTLSSIDDYGLVYEQLDKSGWTMHKDILRWC
ncbi:MAG: glycosyltransferase family 2 protein [Bacteroidia bacterium]